MARYNAIEVPPCNGLHVALHRSVTCRVSIVRAPTSSGMLAYSLSTPSDQANFLCAHVEGFRVPKTGNFPEDPVIEYYEA